eukprot:CAMPEP_0201283944 /NCGR_PEP_ID=MMETSP1317-20130820/55752_1 /ASSEMBLY_ACC=CAM_ASM_000770 /TAXON_ID=187299 /ORGANISM="Undescribed Undescribed, Strain Undescribed" /LENGTH=67 /DNA_ID=CAMNT_0047602057 /DNA_START=151 /DNA_END=354 /DNA_ORIENTATION=+
MTVRGQRPEDRVAVLRGYAAWGARQLDGEVRAKRWEVLGMASAERVWEELGPTDLEDEVEEDEDEFM